jgi:hypothetical protein
MPFRGLSYQLLYLNAPLKPIPDTEAASESLADRGKVGPQVVLLENHFAGGAWGASTSSPQPAAAVAMLES